jgi:hypothetical protein
MRQWLGHADCQAHLAGRLRSSVAVVLCQLSSLAHMLPCLTSRPRQATRTAWLAESLRPFVRESEGRPLARRHVETGDSATTRKDYDVSTKTKWKKSN